MLITLVRTPPIGYTATLVGTQDIDHLEGGLYDDIIIGESADDLISANAGNDILNGGAGRDILNGGYGNDIYHFVFNDIIDATQNGTDIIYDVNGHDIILFDNQISANRITAEIDEANPKNIVLKYMGESFVTIGSQFESDEYGIDALHFSNGETVDIADLIQSDRPAIQNGINGPDNEFGHNWGGIDQNIYRGDTFHSTVPENHTTQEQTLTIQVGTSVSEITEMINDVPLDTMLIVHFESGTHVFNEQLQITRGNIRIQGEEDGSTLFSAQFDDGEIDDLIHIKSPETMDSGQWQPHLSQHIAEVAEEFSYGDQKITLDNTEGLNIGDVIAVTNTAFDSEIEGDFAQFSFATVTQIDGNTLHLAHKLAFDSNNRPSHEKLSDVSIYKVNLLENVSLDNFSIRYDIDVNPEYDAYQLANMNGDYAQNSYFGGNLPWNSASAIRIAGTYGAKLNNITVEQAGSNGIALYAGLETQANNLAVLDTYNRGEGGNGYGIEYSQTYYADVNNITVGAMRHALTPQHVGSSAFNNFHIKYTEANVDFHGGDDRGNIYYIEDMQIMPNTLPNDEEYGYAPFRMVDYRYEESQIHNTVIFDKVTGVESPFEGDAYAHPYFASENIEAGNNGSTLNGGVGHDRLLSGAGNDTFSGGWGRDIFYFDAQNGIDQVMDFDRFDLLHFILPENTILTAQDIFNTGYQSGHDAVFSLSDGNEVRLAYTDISDVKPEQIQIVHNAFDTVFYASPWTDYFNGGIFNDMIDYSASEEAVEINLELGIALGGAAENDTFINIDGIIGSDIVGTRDRLAGDSNDNTFRGMDGNDVINGADGNDVLDGGDGNDSIAGGHGNDTYIYTSGNDYFHEGGSGVDTIIFSSNWSIEDITIDGNIITLSSGDTLKVNDIGYFEYFAFENEEMLTLEELLNYNTPQNQHFIATNSAEIFNGEGDQDIVDYSASDSSVKIDLRTGAGTGGYAEEDTLNNIETLIGSDLSGERDYLYGDDHDNVIYGMNGADILQGRGGADILDGGEGWDYASYADSSAGVNINLKTNINIGGDAEGDTLFNIEAIIGSRHNDTLNGGGQNDYLRGGDGDDRLYGDNGWDLLYGNAGADIFVISHSDNGSYDRIGDFNLESGDRLDFSEILSEYNPVDHAISDFLKVTQAGNQTTIELDADGAENGQSFEHVATLLNTNNLSLEDLI